MEPLQDLETVDRPLTVNHETLKIYSALRQCMKNNQELREALVEATNTIQTLVKALDESKSN